MRCILVAITATLMGCPKQQATWPAEDPDSEKSMQQPLTKDWLILRGTDKKAGNFLVIKGTRSKEFQVTGESLIATQLGGEMFTIRSSPDQSNELIIRSLEDDSTSAIDPGVSQIASIIATNKYVLVGDKSGVTAIDRSSEKLHFVGGAEDMRQGKAYDLFARNGDFILAVDDVLSPFYADIIKMKPNGPPESLGTGKLPSLVNGTYRDAAIAMNTDDTGLAYMMTRATTRGGKSQSVKRLRISSEGKVSFQNEAAIYEVSPWRGQDTVLIGNKLTSWHGIDLVPGTKDWIAIAAGKRGLWVSNLEETAAVSKDNVTDVLMRDDTIFVIAQGKKRTTVIAYSASIRPGATPELLKRSTFSVPSQYIRFVH